MHGLTESQINDVRVLSIVVSALSASGSLFIISCFLYYAHLRKFAFKLVCMLSLCDLLFQISDFLTPDAASEVAMQAGAPTTNLCLTQAVIQSFFELASVLWTTAIAVTLYSTLIVRTSVEVLESRFFLFALVCFGLPTILTLIPGLLNAYGTAGAWCWIRDSFNYLRFVQFYIPLWLAILFNSYVYYVVTRAVSKSLHAAGTDNVSTVQTKQLINRLRFYPLILVVVWLCATINRAVEWANGDKAVFWLFCLQKFFSSLQGFLNAFAYGFSSGVQESLRQSLSEVFPCIDSTPYQIQSIIARPGAVTASPNMNGPQRAASPKDVFDTSNSAFETSISKMYPHRGVEYSGTSRQSYEFGTPEADSPLAGSAPSSLRTGSVLTQDSPQRVVVNPAFSVQGP